MSSPEDDRLSRIGTRWSELAQAHEAASEDAAGSAQQLLQQYTGAVYRYLLGATHDPEVAEELCHEFVLRFLDGRFQGVDPRKGRFRDYLKRVLINLVHDYHRQQSHQPQPLVEDISQPAEAGEDDPSLDTCLRGAVLERTWEALRKSHPGFYAVLRSRVDNPDLSSREMAAQLAQDSGKSITAATVRKTLERARTKFGKLLLQEVAHLTESDSQEALLGELQALDLLKYCRLALAAHQPRSSG